MIREVPLVGHTRWLSEAAESICLRYGAFCTEIDGALVTDFCGSVCNWRCEVLLRIVELPLKSPPRLVIGQCCIVADGVIIDCSA